jgi:hypothetical protein
MGNPIRSMSSAFRHQASLFLNVVLGIAIGLLAMHKLARAAAPAAVQAVARTEAGEVSPRPTPNTPAMVSPLVARYANIASPAERRRWIIEELRAMGVPNDTLALVARVDFDVEWESRFEACGVDRDKLAAVQLDMDMSKDAQMRAALGEEGFKRWDVKKMLWEAMSTEVTVTSSESDAIYAAKKKLEQRELELEQAKVKGSMDDAAINDAEDKAYAEYNQQLKAVLGDDRYAKSQQLDDAFAARNLRYTLTRNGVNPDDSQFQALFKAEQDYSQSQIKLDSSAPDYPAQLKALNDARDQQYRQVLGADAYDIFQKEQDPGYSRMKKYETLWGLDDSKADYVYNTMKSYEKSVQDYQAQLSALQAQGQKVDWDGAKQHLQQLTDQTGQTLQNYLGQNSFDKLQRNHLFLFKPTQLLQ